MLKKSASASKDRLTPRPPTADPIKRSLDLPILSPVVSLPEFNEAEVAAEKWVAKHAFEDPDGSILLPRSLSYMVEGYKRATELIPEGHSPIVARSPTDCASMFIVALSTPTTSVTDSNGVLLSNADGETTPIEPQLSPQPQATITPFMQANSHLLSSELMKSILVHLHFLYDQSINVKDDDCPPPWDQIYPHSKDGSPVISAAGKYIVKLYFMGAWRKVTIDDKIPVDSQGRPLLISSPEKTELWPLLLSKALIKIAALSYKNVEKSCEHGDFDVLHTIRGYIPERVTIGERMSESSWSHLGSVIRGHGHIPSSNSNRKSKDYLTSNAALAKTERSSSIQGSSAARSQTNIRQSGRGQPIVVFAYRDTPRNVTSLVRVVDLKETDEVIPATTCLTLVVRDYSTNCGKPVEALAMAESQHDLAYESDGTLTDSDLVNNGYRCFLFYHAQILFKPPKLINNIIVDASKVADTPRIPPLLFAQDPSRDTNLLVTLSTFGRVQASGLPRLPAITIESYDWRKKSRQESLLRFTTNATIGTFVVIPAGTHALRLTVDCSMSYQVSCWSRDDILLDDEAKYLTERLNVQVKDIDESFAAQPANSWWLLYKQIMMLSAPTFLAADLYVPDPFQSGARLHIINNDTGEEVEPSFALQPRQYPVNKAGYTIIAECKTVVARPPGRWKVRLVSDPPLPADLVTSSWTKFVTQDFEEQLIPNRQNVLFRYLVKLKDTPEMRIGCQLSCTNAALPIRLQILNNGLEMVSVGGMSAATVLNFVVADDSTTKNRYIIQGSVDVLGLLKQGRDLVSAVGDVRPQSGGGVANASSKTPGSGKSSAAKKRTTSTMDDAASVVSTTAAPTAPVATTTETPDLWKLRIFLTEPGSAITSKDTEREDRQKAIKDAWEAAQPGRSTRAKELREGYLKQQDGNIRPTTPAAAAAAKAAAAAECSLTLPRVLNMNEVAMREAEREYKLAEAIEAAEKIRAQRSLDREQRAGLKLHVLERIEQKAREVEKFKEEDLAKRESYRDKRTKEVDEWRTAREAAAREQADLLRQQQEAQMLLEGAKDDSPKKKNKTKN
ncbi:hypothetical protein SmJEL517_g03360 [Synchytrium microbalum]|uniref:Calpain catalytic domain-containing protein n=1 Tax=Synchytrium microbalum TaxID=1806994 RepID=A0A507C7F7_9FUNG|nr:uncharacterized protein SmJEL517_g03360 [Synchytrium microbalum]TPX33926.1 hypothetical protein SmJEL517_g03360 [Synchytrium microbalum]